MVININSHVKSMHISHMHSGGGGDVDSYVSTSVKYVIINKWFLESVLSAGFPTLLSAKKIQNLTTLNCMNLQG